MRKTWVWSLGWDDLLKKGKATYSSVLAWRIPWTIQSMGLQSQAQLSNFYFHCLNSCHGSKWQMIEEKVNGQIWSPSPWIFSFLISSILLISSSFITNCEVKIAQLCPTLWDPIDCTGQNTGVGSLSLLQGIFPIQGLNLGLSHCGRILYQLGHKGSPLHYELKYISIYSIQKLCQDKQILFGLFL